MTTDPDKKYVLTCGRSIMCISHYPRPHGQYVFVPQPAQNNKIVRLTQAMAIAWQRRCIESPLLMQPEKADVVIQTEEEGIVR